MNAICWFSFEFDFLVIGIMPKADATTGAFICHLLFGICDLKNNSI
jgi:hypothetical protein